MIAGLTFAKHRNIRKIGQNLNSANFANKWVFLMSLNPTLTGVWNRVFLSVKSMILGHKSHQIHSQYSQNTLIRNIANFANVNRGITFIFICNRKNEPLSTQPCFQTRGSRMASQYSQNRNKYKIIN